MKTLDQEISAMNKALHETTSEATEMFHKILITDMNNPTEMFNSGASGITEAWAHVRTMRESNTIEVSE